MADALEHSTSNWSGGDGGGSAVTQQTHHTHHTQHTQHTQQTHHTHHTQHTHQSQHTQQSQHKHVGVSTVFDESYVANNKLVDYVPASLTSDNLDRVITHLLSQFVMQQNRVEVLEAASHAQKQELGRVNEDLVAAHMRCGTLEKENERMQTKVDDIEATFKEELVGLQAKLDDEISTSNRRFVTTTQNLSQLTAHTETLEREIEKINEELSKLRGRLARSETLFGDLEILEGTVGTMKNEFHQHKAWALQLEAELKALIADGDELLRSDHAKTAQILRDEMTARRAFEKKFDTLDLDEFRRSLEQLGTSIGYLSAEFMAQNERVDTTLTETTRRVDTISSKLDSLAKQLHLKFNDFIDETDDTSTSILALLSNKVSDILSVLILFEAKVQRTEEGLTKLETHLLDVLRAKDPRQGLKSLTNQGSDMKKAARVTEKEPSLLVHPTTEGIMLGTKQLFKCLSCNRKFKDRTPMGAMSADVRKPNIDPAVPAAYYRSPKHEVKHGRAPLMATVPPVPLTDEQLTPTPPPPVVDGSGARPQSARQPSAVAA